ncbi:hypothetical protein GGI04_004737 [Coemansia thaxteri]|nr:hypothetical protein GGI04_004737 [Coemansia thaxteri]
MVVYIEEFIARHRSFNMARVRQRSAAVAAGGLQHWTAELCARSPELFDFVVTLGGDGTVLYTSWLFQRTVPPIIPFHLGSLGFLTVFDHRHARRVLDSAMRAGVRVNLRMRFTCTVYRLAEAVDPQHANVLVDAADCNRVIDRALATSGLQSCDEHGPRADRWAARTEHRPARTDHKAARTDHRATRTDHAAPPRPVRSFSSGGGGGGARRRSSASPGGNGNGDNGGDGSSSEGGSGGRQPQLSSRSSSTRRRQQQQQQARAGAAPASKPPPAPTPKPPPVAARAPTLNESEWDDVPRAYQQRVRSVWKRDSTFQVMNEVVMDRGPSPYLSKIELYGDGNHLTTVEADGLCLATPTGSTAYSLAAGGSLVHPEIPAILVTPICAHTLSFRPMLLPDSMVVRVVLPPDSRNTAWASFDGRHRIELRRGDHIQITASKYPLPTVCASQSQTQDWMASLSRCLNWNERKRQKTLAGSNDADGPDSMLPPGAAPSDGEIGDDDDEAGEGDALSS